MAKSVNISIAGFQATGQNVSFPQYRVDVTVNWITLAGQARVHTETVLFPNILSNPALSNRWLKDHLQDLMLDALREIQGVDTE